MLEAIQKKVSSLRDEVNEMHPILRELFTGMGTIMHVDYTHGNSEMGADFILTTTHPTFGTDRYIGIIAKNKGITQSTEDVERQIGECFDIKRISLRDNKEIQINEVWVVTTGNISENAKIKFHNRYSGKSVEFINGNELASLINRYIPNFITGLPVKTSLYLEKTKARNLEADKNYSLAPSENFDYIQQDIVKVDEDFYPNRKIKRKVERVDIFQEVSTYRFLLIEGGFGSGKSKLLRRIVDDLCDTALFMDRKLVPIDITFREFFDNYDSDLNSLFSDRIDFDDEDNGYKYVFIIDGLDEKNLSYDERDQVLEKIKSSISGSDRFRVIISSRPVMDKINYKNKVTGVTKYEVSHLTPRKIFEFIEKSCKDISIHKRLITDIQNSPLMRDLPHSPVAAILLAQLLLENSQDLPSNITELYSRYFEFAIGRWDMQKNMQSLKEYEVIENVLMQIAEIMMDENRTFLTISEVKMHIDNYTSARRLGISASHIFELMKLRNDLIIVDESASHFYFKHRSFCEFAYARKMTRLQRFKADPRAFNVYWANSYFFAFGITKDASEQLLGLNDYSPKDDVERFFKIASMPEFALAAYATRYDDIQKVVKSSSIELAKLFIDVKSKKLNCLIMFLR